MLINATKRLLATAEREATTNDFTFSENKNTVKDFKAGVLKVSYGHWTAKRGGIYEGTLDGKSITAKFSVSTEYKKQGKVRVPGGAKTSIQVLFSGPAVAHVTSVDFGSVKGEGPEAEQKIAKLKEKVIGVAHKSMGIQLSQTDFGFSSY